MTKDKEAKFDAQSRRNVFASKTRWLAHQDILLERQDRLGVLWGTFRLSRGLTEGLGGDRRTLSTICSAKCVWSMMSRTLYSPCTANATKPPVLTTNTCCAR